MGGAPVTWQVLGLTAALFFVLGFLASVLVRMVLEAYIKRKTPPVFSEEAATEVVRRIRASIEQERPSTVYHNCTFKDCDMSEGKRSNTNELQVGGSAGGSIVQQASSGQGGTVSSHGEVTSSGGGEVPLEEAHGLRLRFLVGILVDGFHGHSGITLLVHAKGSDAAFGIFVLPVRDQVTNVQVRG